MESYKGASAKHFCQAQRFLALSSWGGRLGEYFEW